MKGKIMNEIVVLKKEIEVQKNLLEIVSLVAKEEGFTIESLEQRFSKYYVPVDNKSGRRCVDGRKPLEFYGDGKVTDYKDNSYTGSQLAGGSAGEVSALRLVTGLSENEAQEVVMTTDYKQGFRLGNHNDNKHGKITSELELSQRIDGCGDQDKSSQGALPMYESLKLDQEVKQARVNWIKEKGGLYLTLGGSHEEKAAVINLTDGITFDTKQAVLAEESVFNQDVREAWKLAPELFQELPLEVKEKIKEADFQYQMTEALIRNYLQTLKALNGPNKLQIKAGIGII